MKKPKTHKPKFKRLNEGEETLALQLRAYKIAFEREFKFHPTRRWRADFHLPDYMILVEIEGGIWMKKGGHNTGFGIMRDMEKHSQAQILGYIVLRYTPNQVKSGQAIAEIRRALLDLK